MPAIALALYPMAFASWQNRKADGYQVRYAANSTFKKAKTVKVKKASTVKAVLKKGVKPFITYYVQVRAYKKVGKKTVYSQAVAALVGDHLLGAGHGPLPLRLRRTLGAVG